MAPQLALPSIEERLASVRSGLNARCAGLGGRIGEQLAGFITRPGKMLRARFCLHLGSALAVEEGKSQVCARVAELTHNASLLHDDCVDRAELRRGQKTPNELYGTTVALLLGDLAFSQAMDEALQLSMDSIRGLVDAVQEMTVGELQEEFVRGSVNVTVDSYMGVAARKTGALFEWCGRALSDFSGRPHDKEDMPRLGRNAGILLQVVDDIHDFVLDDDTAGKTRGQDISADRLTLPIIFALDDKALREPCLELWRQAHAGPGGVARLAEFLDKSGCLEKTRAHAQKLLEEILEIIGRLPDKEGREEFLEFVDNMAWRQF